MRKKLLCMLLASTMLCASGTTVYAAEQPAAQAQAEVTDASGDETDAAVAEEAETLETEEDIEKFAEELKRKLKAQLEEDTIIILS